MGDEGNYPTPDSMVQEQIGRHIRQIIEFHDPPVNGGVIHPHPPFFHEFFHMADAQRISQILAVPRENYLPGEMKLKLTAIVSPSGMTVAHIEGSYPK